MDTTGSGLETQGGEFLKDLNFTMSIQRRGRAAMKLFLMLLAGVWFILVVLAFFKKSD